MTLDEAMELIAAFGPNCLLGICCPPAQQRAAVASMVNSLLGGKDSQERRDLVDAVVGILLDRLDIAPKDSVTPLLKKAGELAGEI